MDNLEEKITRILEKEIHAPVEYEKAIQTAFERKKVSRHKLRELAVACGIVVLMTGVVFAGYTMYEKIWREPKEYDMKKEKPSTISQEERKNVVTEEEIRKKGKEILEKMGYSDKEIKRIDLKRSYSENSELYYSILTEEDSFNKGIFMIFDANTAELKYFLNNEFSVSQDKLEEVSKDRVLKMVRDLLEEIGYSSHNYEIKLCENVEGNNWHIVFSRSYQGIYNRYDMFQISFGVIDNKIVVETINGIQDNTFENNEWIISEEEAISIAQQKESELSNISILNTSAKKSIEKMNTFIYCLENNIQDQSSIKVEDRVRNVWIVKVEHDKTEQNSDKDISDWERFKKYESKKYFVDATTGEIIGGEQAKFNMGIE